MNLEIPSQRNVHRNRGIISFETAMGLAMLLLVLTFAVRNTIRLYHHVQIEEAASRLVRGAARVEADPPYPRTATADFENQNGEKVGTVDYTWDELEVSVVVTTDINNLTASRQLPRESP